VSQSGTGTTDRRVRRTRELLHRTLLDLIGEKGYPQITVQDILDRADVGRSTFYAHYRDKEDLLRSGMADFNAATAAGIERGGGSLTGLLQPLLVMFRHVESHRYMWQPLARHGGLDLGLSIMRESAADLLRGHLAAELPAHRGDPVQLEAAVQFTTGALVGLITWWVSGGIHYTADEAHAIFRRLTIPGLRAFFAPSPVASAVTSAGGSPRSL
jgi:AcrR family transcriptional regulator